MERVIECAGDPRAMGNAQGKACAHAVRERVRRAGGSVSRSRFPSLAALTSGTALGTGMGREVIRHYTHLAERMAGIARHADIPFESLMELFVGSVGEGAGHGTGDESELVSPSVALGGRRLADTDGGTALVRTLPGSTAGGRTWILRKSRPEVGFASLEVTLPWLATAVAGVNEAGVAVAVAQDPARHRNPAPPHGSSRTAPDAVLLVQECLQRFEDVEACLDWSLKRPVSGHATLVLADASGKLSGVSVAGEVREVVEPRGDWLIVGADTTLADAIMGSRTDAAGGRALDLGVLESIGQPSGDLVVWIEPEARRLELRDLAGKPIESLQLDA